MNAASNTLMSLRKLRIAWSAFCGLAAVLLVVLWVRSYWRVEMIACPLTSNYYIGAASQPGCVGLAIHPMGNLTVGQIKRFQRYQTEEWLASVRQDILPNISRIWGQF